MSPKRGPQILTLDQVNAKDPKANDGLCHTFGVFLEEEANCWLLVDETMVKGIQIRMPHEKTLKPRKGDVVRIHRLTKYESKPKVVRERDIVISPSFLDKPKFIYVAKEPSGLDDDKGRFRALETFYSGCLVDDKSMSTHLDNHYYDVAGRVTERKYTDGYIYLELNNGKKKMGLRVFKRQKPDDTDEHYYAAELVEEGDYVVVYNVKPAKSQPNPESVLLDLHSNLSHGKALIKAGRFSILAEKLKEILGPAESNNRQQSPTNGHRREQAEVLQASPRRSLRLSQNSQQSSTPDTVAHVNMILGDSQNSAASKEPNMQSHPPQTVEKKFTKIRDLWYPPNSKKYDFCNLAGQVRGKPEPGPYQNLILQFSDGSKPKMEIDDRGLEGSVKDCATVLVYCKQNEWETDQHEKVVKELEDRDLVYLSNVKFSVDGGKLRLELQANLRHGKKVEKIEPHTEFGKMLKESAANPQVEELLEQPPSDSHGESSQSISDSAFDLSDIRMDDEDEAIIMVD